MRPTKSLIKADYVRGALYGTAAAALSVFTLFGVQSLTGTVRAQSPTPTTQPSKNIVQTATDSSNLTTLVKAVQAADLVGTLNGQGPFTVFAPDNNAFNKLPAGTVDNLLKPENKEQLRSILTYHVVAGNIRSGDLKDGQTVTTVNGQTLMVKISNGKPMINNANVVTADVSASNGTVHIIDTVLMPTNLPKTSTPPELLMLQ